MNKEKEEGGLKDGFVFFMLSYFVIVFWLIFFNAGRLISAIVAACVVCRLVMYRTKVLMYRTMVLLVRLTKVRR